MASTCVFCDGDLERDPITTAEGDRFCSPGCRDVYRTLGTDDGSAVAREAAATETPAEPPAGTTRTFLRVEGMHSPNSESYLESVAEGQPGVEDAEASYVTETIRVDHDTAETSKRELRDAVSALGYTAYLREETTDVSNEHTDKTRRSRETEGTRKRRSDGIFGLRYAAGIIFGAFLMVPYAIVIYPAHLAEMVNHPVINMFEGTFDLSGRGSIAFLRIYFVLTGVILFFTGMPVLRGAYTSLKLRRPTTDILVTITVVCTFVYSAAVILIGQNDIFYDVTILTAASVTGVVFYETAIKQRAFERLTELTVSQVDSATRYTDEGTTETVAVGELEPGDRLLVREGDRIPVDGELVGEECTVEEAVVTGEALPVLKRPGEEVVGGSVVREGAAEVVVDDPVTSSIDSITTSVWNIQSADHGIQRRADQLTRYVLPVVAAIGLGVAGWSYANGDQPARVGLTVLLALTAASPWALGLATPLSVATSIRDALKRDIVVFDETLFERLRDVDTVVFDKTGTLTTSEMEVVETDAPADLLAAAAALERRVSHPAAKAIAREYGPTAGEASGQQVAGDGAGALEVGAFESHPTGVEGVVEGEEVLVGNGDLFETRGWAVPAAIERTATEATEAGQLPVIVGRDGRAEGVVVVGDEPREGWQETVERLAAQDVDVVVLTGDDEEAAAFFARQDAVAHVFAGVPPAGKTATVRALQSEGRVAMVGDGTNDAPALAQANLGISLGSGTAMAADAADVAIVDNDLGSVETAFALAEAAHSRVTQNIWLALLYNVIAIPVALLGLFNPLTAMVAVAVSAGLIGLNSSRDLLGGAGIK